MLSCKAVAVGMTVAPTNVVRLIVAKIVPVVVLLAATKIIVAIRAATQVAAIRAAIAVITALQQCKRFDHQYPFEIQAGTFIFGC